MNKHWEIVISVRPPFSMEEMRAGYNLSEKEHPEFRPIDRVPNAGSMTEALLYHSMGSKNPEQTRITQQERKRLAEHISKSITDHILKSLDKRDTYRGYPHEHTGGEV